MGKHYKPDNTEYWWECKNTRNTYKCLVGVQIGTSTLQGNLATSSKVVTDIQ